MFCLIFHTSAKGTGWNSSFILYGSLLAVVKETIEHLLYLGAVILCLWTFVKFYCLAVFFIFSCFVHWFINADTLIKCRWHSGYRNCAVDYFICTSCSCTLGLPRRVLSLKRRVDGTLSLWDKVVQRARLLVSPEGCPKLKQRVDGTSSTWDEVVQRVRLLVSPEGCPKLKQRVDGTSSPWDEVVQRVRLNA